MSDFKKVFGNRRDSSDNIISLDGTISRSRISPNSFSSNTKPIVFKSKKDLVRESPTSDITLPSTKGITRPVSKPPQSKFTIKPKREAIPTPSLVEKITTKPVVVIDREAKQLSEIEPINFQKNGEIVLTGAVNTNKIKFDRYSLNDIIGIDSVSFQFILRLIVFSGEYYYTSSNFKNKLLNNYSNNLPYAAISALNPSSVVTVDLRNALNSLGTEYALAEQNDGAFVNYNTFIDATGKIDFIKAVEYIDWVVSKPPTEYDDRIIPAETLGNWSIIGGIDVGSSSIPKSSGTAVPTEAQPSDEIPNVVNPIVSEPQPPKKIPLSPITNITPILPKGDKPKPVGSGLVELPIIKPVPNRFSGFSTSQQNAVARNFASIVSGANLVPEIPVASPTLRNITGIDWDGINSERVRKPRNIL